MLASSGHRLSPSEQSLIADTYIFKKILRDEGTRVPHLEKVLPKLNHKLGADMAMADNSIGQNIEQNHSWMNSTLQDEFGG